MVIQKADKGNTIVILNKNDYISRLNRILDETSKFKRLHLEEGKILNHIIHTEQRIIDLFKSLKNQNEISEKNYDNLYPSGSKPGILYGLGKIHKALKEEIPTFRRILSAIGTPTYKLAKFCDKLLKPITTNEYTIKDSFSFAKEVEEFDSNLKMATFDVKSLFTKIPLTETIGLCVENLYRNQTHIDNISKNYFRRLLEMAMYESFFIFDQKYYKQCDGVAMGSPLGLTLANVFMCHFENIRLENCPTQFKLVVYRRYVGDTFLLFRSTEHAEKFKNYLNKQHKNIALTSEMEQNDSLSFLDITISRENKFVTSV